jgi:hypothetical protein
MMKFRGVDFTGLAYLAALGVGAFVVYRVVTRGPAAVGDAVAAVGGAAGRAVNLINPANPENIFALTANSAVRAVTAEPDATLGTKLWEWLHPDQVAAERAMFTDEAKRAGERVRLTPSADGGDFIARYYGEFTGTYGDQIPNIGGPVFSTNEPVRDASGQTSTWFNAP